MALYNGLVISFLLAASYGQYISYGKQVNYNSTFGNYFAHGFKVAALVTAIMIIYIVIFITLFPEFKEKAMDEARIAMQEKNNMTEEQIKQALEYDKKIFHGFSDWGHISWLSYFWCSCSINRCGHY